MTTSTIWMEYVTNKAVAFQELKPEIRAKKHELPNVLAGFCLTASHILKMSESVMSNS
jgi:hypothetical protein